MSTAPSSDSPAPAHVRAEKGSARLPKRDAQVSGKTKPARLPRRRSVFVPSEEFVTLAVEVLGAKSGRKLSRKEAREAVLTLGEFFGTLRDETPCAGAQSGEDATDSVLSPFCSCAPESETAFR